MAYLDTMDFERTLRDFEFTRKAQRQIRKVVTSASFEDMDTDQIFYFLYTEMEMVSFKDYLKRYLFERAGLPGNFKDVSPETFSGLIKSGFEENNVPYSLEGGSTRPQAAIKSWLSSERVRRESVFLLGFALRMNHQDVSDFLTKVLKEDGFRLDEPLEAIFAFCFQHDLPYARASELRRVFEALPKREGSVDMATALQDEAALLTHLSYLKGHHQGEEPSPTLACFTRLYEESREAIAALYLMDEEEKPPQERRAWQAIDISPADFEQVLYSGIPTSPEGNLKKANLSLLYRQFASYRLSRQRLAGIFSRRLKPDRFDLMTLSFFLHTQKDLPGEERLRAYLDQTNRVLDLCGLGQVHAANPYEAFLLICILSDAPLAVFTEIWELSYPEGQA